MIKTTLIALSLILSMGVLADTKTCSGVIKMTEFNEKTGEDYRNIDFVERVDISSQGKKVEISMNEFNQGIIELEPHGKSQDSYIVTNGAEGTKTTAILKHAGHKTDGNEVKDIVNLELTGFDSTNGTSMEVSAFLLCSV